LDENSRLEDSFLNGLNHNFDRVSEKVRLSTVSMQGAYDQEIDDFL
jgi:hypothetical protein